MSMKVKVQLSRRGTDWQISNTMKESTWPADEREPDDHSEGWTTMDIGYNGK